MRILQLSNYYPEHIGGIETVADSLARLLRGRGHELRWIAAEPPGYAHTGPAADHPLAAWNITEERFGFPYPLTGPRAWRRIRTDVEWCDVLHVHDCLYVNNVVAAELARRRRRPVLVTQHVAEVPYASAMLRGLQHTAYTVVGRRVLQQADRVVFVSETTRRAFAARMHFRHAPIVIENGVDTDVFSPAACGSRAEARARLGLNGASPLLLFVGRFVAKKGISVIRDVAWMHPEWRWVLIGRQEPRDAIQWPASVTVKPVMDRRKLRFFYRAADLVVLPSVGEGFPVVAQEALACGTPVIMETEAAHALSKLVGVLPADAEAAAVARAIAQQVADLDATRDLGDQAAVEAARRWGSAAFGESYENVLTSMTRPVRS